MRGIGIGDEVYCRSKHLFAQVIEVFPAAVCVRIGLLSFSSCLELLVSPQLWCADDIENLSVCRYCGSREGLCFELETGAPFRLCEHCRSECLNLPEGYTSHA